MKTKIFTLSLLMICLFSSTAYSQDSKLSIIASKNKTNLCVLNIFDSESGEVINKTYALIAQNEEYDYIVDNFDIASGQIQDIYDKLIMLKKYADKYPNTFGVGSKQDGLDLYRCNILGKCIMITKNGKYVYLRDSSISFFIDKLIKYCEKNNIPLENNR